MADMKGRFDMKFVSRTTDIAVRAVLIVAGVVTAVHFILEYVKGR